ncbi:MAG: hypothetical protein BAJATHORv1_30379 [Candidatus Thorarchaeota archaeon]|nr:MAG: hypothetical protein BAJATHORv1_30379 [Candidatus Thorarchaeota archaeon]
MDVGGYMTEEHKYELTSRFVSDKIVSIRIAGKPEFEVATPPDFWEESPEGILSPEDLFLASAVSCYGVSLSGVSKKYRAEFHSFDISVEGHLKQGEYGWEFAEMTINATITVPTAKDKKKMEKAADRAHRYCVVSNSMSCPVHLNAEIVVVE